jgi:lactoylglutathione lyase
MSSEMFSEMFPILTVRDLPRALGFYRDLLGGRETYRFPPEGEPAYVSLRIAGAELGLAAEPDRVAAPSGVELCVYTDDCDKAVAHLRQRGVPVIDEPADQPWGERLARVTDPDGHRLMILSRTAAR